VSVLFPRYTVGSITGFRFMHRKGDRYPSERGSGNSRPTTDWYVYDRAYNYRPVLEISGYRRLVPGELTARLTARRLNKEYERWLREQGYL